MWKIWNHHEEGELIKKEKIGGFEENNKLEI